MVLKTQKNCGASGNDLERLAQLASEFYQGINYESRFEGLKVNYDEFATAVRAVEEASVTLAGTELKGLMEEHRQLTLSWAKASDLQQDAICNKTPWRAKSTASKTPFGKRSLAPSGCRCESSNR
jgi:predicted metal-dependent hydrolase